MTAITHALTKINTIPKEILKYAFANGSRSFVNQDGLIEQRIIEKIIQGRLRQSIDIVGPTEMEILLDNKWKKRIDMGSYMIHLPIEKTKGKRLISIQSMTLGRLSNTTSVPTGGTAATYINGYMGSSMGAQTHKLLAASAPPQVLSTAEMEIVGKNVILVTSANQNITRHLLTGLFSTDDNFSNIMPQLYDRFAKCALYLTESYIYTECYLKLSRNALSAGKEFSEFRELVSRYEASEEKFEEEMKLFKKAMRVNDPLRKKKHNHYISQR